MCGINQIDVCFPNTIIKLIFSYFSCGLKEESRIIWTLIFVFLTQIASAQEPFYQPLTTQDGLPSNNVYEVRQDKDGYMWMATDNGVARFDGGHFVNFTQSNGLSDNDVFMVRPDSKGRVWFLPSNGKPCFWQNGLIHNETNTPFLKQMRIRGWFNAFGEDAAGNIWFGAFRNLIIKLDINDQVTRVGVRQTPWTIFSDIRTDPSGDAWLVNSEGLINLSKAPEQVTISLKLPFEKPQRSLYLPNIGIFYTSGNQVGLQTESDSIRVPGIDLKNGCIFLSQSSNGDIWLSNLHDLYWFKKGKVSARNMEILIHDKPVAGVFTDREQNIWVYTLGEGILVINQPGIRHFKSVFGEGGSAPFAVFADPRAGIWIGGDHGNLARMEGNEMVQIPEVKKMAAYGRGRIRSIRPIDGHRFALAFEQRLVFMNNNGIDTRMSLNTRCILDHRDKYWVGTSTGCFAIPKSRIPELVRLNVLVYRDSIPAHTKVMSKYNLMAGFRIDDLEADTSGTVWVATTQGLYFFKPGMEKGEPFYHRHPLMQRPIFCLRSLNSRILLMAISGAGLGILKNGLLHFLPHALSLKDAAINRIVTISDRSFWLCTNKGLFLLTLLPDDVHVTIKPYTIRDGLLSEQVTDIARWGEDWLIISDKGLTVFPANLMGRKSGNMPSLLSASFFINNKLLDSKMVYTENETQVRFSYGCLSFKDLGALTFRYRLNEEDFWKSSKEFQHTISNLAQGHYRFEVQASSYGNTWGPSLFFPEFEVLPPFWQRGWFLFLVLLVSSGFTAAIFYFGNRSRLERLDLDRRLTDANLKALRAQIKPHFIFNALNSVQYYFLGNKKEEGLEFLGRFSLLMRKMLSGSDKQFHSVKEELGLMTDYLDIEKNRIGKSFQFKIQIDPEISQEQTLVPTMLLQPLVENALWHGIMHREKEGGVIDLEVIRKTYATQILDSGPKGQSNEKDRLLISITDNGVGRKFAADSRNKDGNSFGLRSIEEKIALLNIRYKSQITIRFEDLTDVQNIGIGTKVILDLPLHFSNS